MSTADIAIICASAVAVVLIVCATISGIAYRTRSTPGTLTR